MLCLPFTAWATAYIFPGTLPSGCTNPSSGNYSCGALTLNSADTITINAPTPASISFSGALSVGAAQINASGAASSLSITVSGNFSATAGAVVNADITASKISSTGAASYGGSLTTTSSGDISIGAGSTVSGSLTSTSGDVTLSTGKASSYTTVGSISTGGTVSLNSYNRIKGNTTGYFVSSSGHTVYGGNITGTTTYVSLGGNASVTGSISAQTYVDTGSSSTIRGSITAHGAYIDTGDGSTIDGSLSAGGEYVAIHSNATVGGSITAATYVSGNTNNTIGGDVTAGTYVFMDTGSTAGQCVRAQTSTIRIPTTSSVGGACCGSDSTCTNSCITVGNGGAKPPLCSTLDHVEVSSPSSSGLTCSPTTFTIKGCANAACSAAYTYGLSGTLSLSGSGMTVNYPAGSSFSIAAGSSQTTLSAQVTTAGSVTVGTSGLSATPTNSPGTWCGLGSAATASGTCSYSVAGAGFIFDVPNHVSETSQSVNVSAVQKSNTSNACVPAFASQTKAVTFTCGYGNPGSGTLPVRVTANSVTKALDSSNSASAACDGTGQAVNLAFDSSGVALIAVQYADAGQMQLTASYTGAAGSSEAGLSMTGSDTFVAAPASFTVATSLVSPATKYVAGVAFGTTVRALNNAGNTTPNYGNESAAATPTLSFNRVAPTGSGTSGGSFSGSLGSFANGVATGSNAVWSEVGIGDLTATIDNYLGSGLSATGSTGTAGAVGPFIAHRFTLATTQACTTGTTPFTYAGQSFTASITATNAAGNRTYNYTGAYAKATTLTAATLPASVGTFGTTGAVASSSFTNGLATTTTPAFSFVNKLTAQQTDTVRATDTDGVSSSGHETAAGMTWRSGRLRLSNAFGSEKASLGLTAQTQYWSGNGWVANSDDRCTLVPRSAVALSNYLSNQGSATTTWTTTASAPITIGLPSATTAGGMGTLTLSAPSPTLTGSVDIGLNLGTSTAADVSCLANHPATTGAGVPWLQSQNGNCASTYNRDPSARATFGIYSPETKKLVHTRELY